MSNLTRCHFVDLAKVLAATKPTGLEAEMSREATLHTVITQSIADLCEKYNGRFDRRVFYRAAGRDDLNMQTIEMVPTAELAARVLVGVDPITGE